MMGDRDFEKTSLKTLIGSEIKANQALRGPNKGYPPLSQSRPNLVEVEE